MGSSDKGVLRGRRRLGRAMWFMGYHPLYALATSIFRMRDDPRLSGGLMMIFGYVASAAAFAPRYPHPDFRRYLQRWQLSQLKSLLSQPR